MRRFMLLVAALVVLSLTMSTTVSAQFTVPLENVIFKNYQNSSYNATTNKITITRNVGSDTQYAYYPSYLRLFNQTHFEVDVTFEFNKGGPGADGADGFAFVLHNLGFGAIGAFGGNLGVPLGAFGVAFQTYTNRRIQVHLVNGTLINSATVPELQVPTNTYKGPYNASIVFDSGNLVVKIDGNTRFSGWVEQLDESLLGNDVVMGFTGATGGAYELCYLSSWRVVNFATLVLSSSAEWSFNTSVDTALSVSSAADGFLSGASSFGVNALTWTAQCDSGSLAISADGTFTYTPPSTTGEANCNVSASDGSTQSNMIAAKFYIGEAPNDEPVITLPSQLQGTVSVYESDNYTLSLQDIVISDSDASSQNLSMTIRVSYESSDRFSYIHSQSGLTDLFEQGIEIDFRPIPINTADATVTITVNDNGNSGSGGAKESTATINVEFSASSSASQLASWVSMVF